MQGTFQGQRAVS